MEGAWRKIILFEGQNMMLANFSSYWSYLGVTQIRFRGMGKAKTTICLKKSLYFCYKDAKLLMKVGFSIGRYAMVYMCLAHAKKTMVVLTELHMWTREEASCRHRLSTLAQRNRKKTETQRCLHLPHYVIFKKGDCWVKVCNTISAVNWKTTLHIWF